MKLTQRIAFVSMILSGITCILMYLIPWIMGIFPLGETGSIGIIGSSDGPTAILVTKNSAPLKIVPMVFILSLLAWFYCLLKIKNHKN